MYKYKVNVTETLTRSVWVTADSPGEAERIAEENYDEQEVSKVEFEADPLSKQLIEEGE